MVSVSPQFFGWVAGVGKGMEILGPQDVRNEYKKYLEEMLEKYKKCKNIKKVLRRNRKGTPAIV